jgi:hypothetical protein
MGIYNYYSKIYSYLPLRRIINKWDGKDNMGKNVSAGVYFCRLQTGKFQDTVKLAVVK